jgi:hypothetical protein
MLTKLDAGCVVLLSWRLSARLEANNAMAMPATFPRCSIDGEAAAGQRMGNWAEKVQVCGDGLVEPRGIEPLTSSLRTRRSPS